MAVHIGKVIQLIVKQREISVVNFANQINCSPRNVYQIFKKEHIDTELLTIISEKLNLNLFLNYLLESDLIAYQHHKHSEELLEKMTGSEKPMIDFDLIYDTQDPLTIKLTNMIIDLQAEVLRLKG